MAFGALGAGLTGALQGFNEAQQSKRDRAAAQADLDLRREQAADAHASALADQQYRQQEMVRQRGLDAVSARASGLNADGTPLAPLPLTGGAVAPAPNKGDYVRGLLNQADMWESRANQLAAAGRRDEADQAMKTAQNKRLTAQTYATTTIGLQGTLPLDRSRIGLVNAQAAAARDLPQRARQIAKWRDQTSEDNAIRQVSEREWATRLTDQTRRDVAQYQGADRYAIAAMTAAYRAQNVATEEATQRAIADYRGQVSVYNQQQRPYAATDTVPAYAPPPPGLTVNYNLPAPPVFPGAPALPGAAAPPGGAGGVPPPAAPSVNVQTEIANIQAGMKAGATAHAIRATLNARVASGALTAAQRDQIEKSIPGLAQIQPLPVRRPTLAPLPASGRFDDPIRPLEQGGSQGTAPF